MAIVGAIAVSSGLPFYANVIWLPSNIYLSWYNYKLGQMSLARLFGIYCLIALYGVINLWPK